MACIYPTAVQHTSTTTTTTTTTTSNVGGRKEVAGSSKQRRAVLAGAGWTAANHVKDVPFGARVHIMARTLALSIEWTRVRR